jgi:hypothetical protein
LDFLCVLCGSGLLPRPATSCTDPNPRRSSLPATCATLRWSRDLELKVFDRFPKCVGVVRDNCIALLVPSVGGLQMLGTPGWQMGEALGVLVEAGGRRVFQAKQEIVEATPERLEALKRFREDLEKLLRPAS